MFDRPVTIIAGENGVGNLGGQTQAIIATHSPILMALSGARLLKMGKYGLEPTLLEDTEHFRILREFVSDRYGFVEAMLDEP